MPLQLVYLLMHDLIVCFRYFLVVVPPVIKVKAFTFILVFWVFQLCYSWLCTQKDSRLWGNLWW